MGLNVPTDLSIAGFDNIPESTATHPPLTTVDQSIQELGSIAVELLIDVIEGNQIEKPAAIRTDRTHRAWLLSSH